MSVRAERQRAHRRARARRTHQHDDGAVGLELGRPENACEECENVVDVRDGRKCADWRHVRLREGPAPVRAGGATGLVGSAAGATRLDLGSAHQDIRPGA